MDPLDGTQEFIAGSGDFSTMIALMENGKPVLGVVYGPVNDLLYYAVRGQVLLKKLLAKLSVLMPAIMMLANR